MHMVGNYSRDKEHKASILADNLDRQAVGDKVDMFVFEAGTPAADRASKRGETAAPRSGEQAAHPSHVRDVRTADRQRFVLPPGHYPLPKFDRCQEVAFREFWSVQGVAEYSPALPATVPTTPRLAVDSAPQSPVSRLYIQNSLSLSFLPMQVGRCLLDIIA